jgi:hypothetical protein
LLCGLKKVRGYLLGCEIKGPAIAGGGVDFARRGGSRYHNNIIVAVHT